MKKIKKRVKVKISKGRSSVYIEWIKNNLSKDSTLKDLPDDLLILDEQDKGMVAMFLALWLSNIKNTAINAALSDDDLFKFTNTVNTHITFENLHRAGMLIYPDGYFPLVKLLDPDFYPAIELNKEHPQYKELEAMSPALREDYINYQIALGKQQASRAFDGVD